MTFQTPSGFTQIDTDSGTATITNTKPNLDIVGTGGVSTSATGNTITVDGSDIALRLVDSFTVGASASEVILNAPSGARYLLYIENFNPFTNAVFLSMEVSNDGGSTWKTSGYQSSVRYWAWNSTTLNNNTSTAAFRLSGPLRNDRSAIFQMWFGNMNTGADLNGMGESNWEDTTLSAIARGITVGQSTGTTGVNALRFFVNSGDIDNGNFFLYQLI